MIPPVPLAALLAFLAYVALQRSLELILSARNARALARRGAVLHRERAFPLFVLLHAGFPAALAAEVLALGARPGPAWPLWLALFAGAQALRYAAMATLGTRWNVRIWVVPGLPRVRSGPYRWLRHPNYVAVAIELLAGPLLFGAWRTAIACSLLNALLLARRIPLEEAALGGEPPVPPGPDRSASRGPASGAPAA